MIEKRINNPPDVGVPSLIRWVDGPSFLTFCAQPIFLSFAMNKGASSSVIRSAVTVAYIALKVRYLNTLKIVKYS